MKTWAAGGEEVGRRWGGGEGREVDEVGGRGEGGWTGGGGGQGKGEALREGSEGRLAEGPSRVHLSAASLGYISAASLLHLALSTAIESIGCLTLSARPM